MRTMSKKSILTAGVAAAAVGLLGAYAVAQTGPGGGHGRMGGEHGMMQGKGHGGGMGGMGQGRGAGMGTAADVEARLAAAKTEIGITAVQSPAWDTYAKVVTTFAAERREHREKIDHDAVHKMDQKQRDAFRKSMQKQRDETVTKVKAAADTLLTQLDAAQKDKAQRTLPGLAVAESGPRRRAPRSSPGPRPGRRHR